MDLSDCVPKEDRLPGYEQVPTERLYAEAKPFYCNGNNEPLIAWLESFRKQGYTKPMAWLCYTVIAPFPTLLAHIVAEAPCK